MRYLSLAGALLLLLAAPVAAQSLDELRGGALAFYQFAEPGEITVTVKVWGAVDRTGLYEVRQAMPLSTLLTLAGGPTPKVDSRSRRTLFIRLYRPDATGAPVLFYETEMEETIQMLVDDPTLLHGDTVVVDEEIRVPFSWRDGLSILTVTASLASIIIQLARGS